MPATPTSNPSTTAGHPRPCDTPGGNGRTVGEGDGRRGNRLEIGNRDERTAVGRPAITLTREDDRDPGAERIDDAAGASSSRADLLDHVDRRTERPLEDPLHREGLHGGRRIDRL